MSSSSKSKPDGVKKKLFQYSPHKVGLALEAIRKGMKVSTASKNFNVPRTTLRHKISGEAPETTGHVGPQAVLGKQIENELVEWIKECARAGFPINKEGLLDSVKKIVEKGGLKTPFINNRPSRSWFEGFMARHPDLSQKHAEYINKARALITEKKIRNWFIEVSSLIGTKDLEILNNPSRVWNCDETAFFLAPKGGLVLAEKGQHVYDTSKNSDKDNVTTLFTVNALGEYAPPLTVYKYKRISTEIIQNAPDGWGIGKTDKGWMTGEAFYEYVGNVFLPYIKEKEIELPIILFLDGHRSHLTMQVSKLCRENGIIVTALVPNTTHMLQPLDVAVFYPLKQNWRKLVKKWRIENDGQEITKNNLPSALNSLLIKNETFANNVKAGFKTCGLYPFGPDFVNYKRIVKPQSDKNENCDVVVMKNTLTESSYLAYLEGKIDKNLLKEFNTTFESGLDWNGKQEATMLYDTWLAFKNDITATKMQTNQEVISKTFEDPCTSVSLSGVTNNENSTIREVDTRSEENLFEECCTSPSVLDNSHHEGTIFEITDTQNKDNSYNKEYLALKDVSTFDEPCASPCHLVNCDQKDAASSIFEQNGTLDEDKYNKDLDICNQKDFETQNTVQEKESEKEDPALDTSLEKPCAASSHLVISDREVSPLRTSEKKDALGEHKSDKQTSVFSANVDTCNKKDMTIQNNNEKEKISKYSLTRQTVTNTARDLVRECVLYPGKVVPKNTRKAIYIPSVITSNKWWDIMEAAKNEKKEKQVNKKKKEIKIKTSKKKKVSKDISSSEEDGEVEFIESDDSEWNEQSDTNSNEEEMIDQGRKPVNKPRNGSKRTKRKRSMTEDSSSESEQPLNKVENSNGNKKQKKKVNKGNYVIIKYEGEYFPGKIENEDKGLYEISSMVFSTGNTFRWPERPDKIWYKISDIVEVISPPVKNNNRGFFKVKEMEKFLPDIYSM